MIFDLFGKIQGCEDLQSYQPQEYLINDCGAIAQSKIEVSDCETMRTLMLHRLADDPEI